MHKSLTTVALLLAISGCTSQNNIANAPTDSHRNKQLASKLVSIHKHEIAEGKEITLLRYINDKDQLCFQWVKSAKKTDSGIETSIAVHCGKYEIRHDNNSVLGSVGEYVPIDIQALTEYRNKDGLLVQSIAI
ncbi:hypothetical protein HUO09_17475 [Vibrio sp. Y2-5]|uniref:hypothetical protein n=1 Tax=Vibrio sp. Y2-5 TaxID=2743977 RepID=UPI00166180A5|nr:hypothetical protein [Vibrio sp. Y2-5]MBD0788148.1 hypothetical protein [Vibrio sp. Y2-5]